MQLTAINVAINNELKALKKIWSRYNMRAKRASYKITPVNITLRADDYISIIVKSLSRDDSLKNRRIQLIRAIRIIRLEKLRVKSDLVFLEFEQSNKFIKEYKKKVSKNIAKIAVLFDAKSEDEINVERTPIVVKANKIRYGQNNFSNLSLLGQADKELDEIISENSLHNKYISEKIYDAQRYKGDRTRELAAKYGLVLGIGTAAIGQSNQAWVNINLFYSWVIKSISGAWNKILDIIVHVI